MVLMKLPLVPVAGLALMLGAAAALADSGAEAAHAWAASAAISAPDPRLAAPRLRLAQGGSTGGTLGKKDQSLSGDQPAAKGPGQPSSSISGTWKWIQDCQGGTYRGNFRISQTGANSFGGSVYQEAPEASGAIVEGRIQGSQLSFKVTLNAILETFQGSVAAGRLEGTSTSQNYAPCTWRGSRG
jgi:hypothetical protein